MILQKLKICSCTNKFLITKGLKGVNGHGKEVTYDIMQCSNLDCNKHWLKPK